MSLQTWKDEFYRIPARGTAKMLSLQYSLDKWSGLLPENLARHGVELQYTGAGTSWELKEVNATEPHQALPGITGDSTCALCHHFYESSGGPHACDTCPIVIAGKPRCGCQGSAWRATHGRSALDKLQPELMVNELLDVLYKVRFVVEKSAFERVEPRKESAPADVIRLKVEPRTITVPVSFTGEVRITAPAGLSKELAQVLAEHLACSRLTAIVDDPQRDHNASVLRQFQDKSGLSHAVSAALWNSAKVELVEESTLWASGEDAHKPLKS